MVALIKTVLVVLYIQLSGSTHQFLMPVWKCFNLSWLVILALILLCGLTQGLDTSYFFIRLYFFLLLLIAIEMVKLCDWLPLEQIPEMHHGSLVREPRHSSTFSLPPLPISSYSSTALQSISADTSRAWRGRPRFVSRLTSSSSHFVVLVLHCQV